MISLKSAVTSALSITQTQGNTQVVTLRRRAGPACAKGGNMSAANEGWGGTYDVVAITACPTGIAHTFMAAKGLEDQAAKMGVSIKVETRVRAALKCTDRGRHRWCQGCHHCGG
ncbi:MAG: PTS fructose transporter subunit IIB [Collinsella aerofaciens]